MNKTRENNLKYVKEYLNTCINLKLKRFAFYQSFDNFKAGVFRDQYI